jgi:hypothetical protein
MLFYEVTAFLLAAFRAWRTVRDDLEFWDDLKVSLSYVIFSQGTCSSLYYTYVFNPESRAHLHLVSFIFWLVNGSVCLTLSQCRLCLVSIDSRTKLCKSFEAHLFVMYRLHRCSSQSIECFRDWRTV